MKFIWSSTLCILLAVCYSNVAEKEPEEELEDGKLSKSVLFAKILCFTLHS